MTRSQLLITVTVMLGVFMAIIDMTIVNVALPTIAGNLGASLDDAAWVATGYILAAIVVMPLNGWLTAYLGRKTFYCGWCCAACCKVSAAVCCSRPRKRFSSRPSVRAARPARWRSLVSGSW